MKIQAEICVCDVCGHRWLAETAEPTNCPSRKCRSTKWNSKPTTKPEPKTAKPEASPFHEPSTRPDADHADRITALSRIPGKKAKK